MSKRAKSGPVGRYDGGYDARVPGALGQPVSSANMRTAVAAVPNPYEPKARILVTVNRRVDILEQERSHGRISEAAYRTGRIVQAVFERAGGVSASRWNPGERVDTTLARELSMIHAVDNARRITKLMTEIEASVGAVGARFLRSVLIDRQPFADLAASRGRSGERGAASIAQRFRDLLEDLTEDMTARGRDRARLRASREEPVDGEEFDERGCLVPGGERGYRVGS